MQASKQASERASVHASRQTINRAHRRKNGHTHTHNKQARQQASENASKQENMHASKTASRNSRTDRYNNKTNNCLSEPTNKQPVKNASCYAQRIRRARCILDWERRQLELVAPMNQCKIVYINPKAGLARRVLEIAKPDWYR